MFTALAQTYGMTAGRTWSVVAAVLGLGGLVLGGLALSGRFRFPVVGLAVSVAGSVVGLLVVVMAKGGPGTGYGIVGGYITLVLGLVAALLCGVALRRKGVRAAGSRAE